MVLGKKVFYLLSSGMECCRWGHGYAGWSDFKGQCLDSAWMDEAMVELVEGGEACFLKIGSISGVGMGRLHIWPVRTGRTWKWELRLHSWAGCFTTFNQLCHMVHRTYTVRTFCSLFWSSFARHGIRKRIIRMGLSESSSCGLQCWSTLAVDGNQTMVLLVEVCRLSGTSVSGLLGWLVQCCH